MINEEARFWRETPTCPKSHGCTVAGGRGDSDSFTPFVEDERKQGWWLIIPSSAGPLGEERDAILAVPTGIG